MCSEDMIILGLQKTSPCCKILILMLQVADSCLHSTSSLLNIWSSLFITIIIKTRTTDTVALGVPRAVLYVHIPPCCSGGRSLEMIVPREHIASRSGGPGTLCSLPGHILLMGSLCVCKVHGSFMSPR